MHFLLSNDDGYQSPGIELLAVALATLGQVSVVAPDRNRSGASNSLTLEAPLYARTARNGFIYVNGTPTDCVHIAITGLLDNEPDMVISGINAGANLGDDVLYSGTVAAAMEGRFLGVPAMSVSLTSTNPQHYPTAVEVTLRLVKSLLTSLPRKDLLLNVNVPDVPYAELTGFAITRLGQRHKSEPAIHATDPHGYPVYWVGPVGPEQDTGTDTDFHAIRQKRVSITPLQVDLTRYSVFEELQQWSEALTRNEG